MAHALQRAVHLAVSPGNRLYVDKLLFVVQGVT
jgi:hypothetical protein